MSNKFDSGRSYGPVNPFSLGRDFLKTPLMATIKLARFKFVSKMLSSDDVVLDMGCGNGMSSYYYASVAKRVIGIDLYADIDQVAKAMARENLRFMKEDLLKMDYSILKPEGITAVTSVDVIEHFYREDGEKIIANSAELLAKGGVMITGTPSKFSGAYRSEQSRLGHYYEYEPEELKSICDKYFGRTFLFSMNDEVVHTGFSKLAWFFFVICVKT